MSTAKGTRHENHVMHSMLGLFPNMKRVGKSMGSNDPGDFHNTGDWLLEAKWRKSWSAPFEWVRKTRAKAERDGKRWAIVFAADRRRWPGTYVLLDLETFTDLLTRAGEGEPKR